MNTDKQAHLMILIGALIDVAEGNCSSYAAGQIKDIEKKIEKLILND